MTIDTGQVEGSPVHLVTVHAVISRQEKMLHLAMLPMLAALWIFPESFFQMWYLGLVSSWTSQSLEKVASCCPCKQFEGWKTSFCSLECQERWPLGN